MPIRRHSSLLLLLALAACEPAENVRVQELPPLERSSVESRLGLPALVGAWPFAGWELAEGDSAGMEAELPVFGGIQVVEQKRDSLGGVYTDAAGAAAPLSGEIRRNGVVALVAFPGGGAGRYLVGSVEGDTLWVESSTLAGAEWREDARAAFIRGAAVGAPFRRIRGMVAAAPVLPVADTLAAGADSTMPANGVPGAAGAGVGETGPGAPAGAAAPSTGAPAAGAGQPVADTDPEPTQEEPEPQPEAQPQPRPAPTVERRDPPRVLGEPVQRDNDLP